MHFDGAEMRARLVAQRAMPLAALEHALQRRPHFELLLGELDHQALSGAHLIGQRRQLFGQPDDIGVAGDATFLTTRQNALQIVERVGRLLKQRLDEGRRRSLDAGEGDAAALAEPCMARKPFLNLAEEAALRETGLQIEEAQYQRCLLYTSPSPRDRQKSRMPSSA